MGTRNWGQGFGDRDLRAGIWGQGFGDRDLGTGIWGQGFGDRDLGTGSWGQGVLRIFKELLAHGQSKGQEDQGCRLNK